MNYHISILHYSDKQHFVLLAIHYILLTCTVHKHIVRLTLCKASCYTESLLSISNQMSVLFNRMNQAQCICLSAPKQSTLFWGVLFVSSSYWATTMSKLLDPNGKLPLSIFPMDTTKHCQFGDWNLGPAFIPSLTRHSINVN